MTKLVSTKIAALSLISLPQATGARARLQILPEIHLSIHKTMIFHSLLEH